MGQGSGMVRFFLSGGRLFHALLTDQLHDIGNRFTFGNVIWIW